MKVGSIVATRTILGRIVLGHVSDIPEHDRNMVRVETKGKGRWMRKRDVLAVIVP